MAEKKYYWLKLQDDFFSSKRIKKLRKLAGGDTFTIIYLKMQLLSLKTNGVIEFTGLESDFAEEIALDIDEDSENVKLTIAYLLSCGLLLTSDNVEYTLPFVLQNTGSESKWAEKKRTYRGQLKDNERTLLGQCPREIEKEIEKEIEIDNKASYKDVIELYSSICISYPSIKSISEARKKAINARLKSYSLDDFRTLFENAEKSDFLKGKNDKNWSANFDWLIKDSNMAKVIDGNYANKKSGNKFNNFQQRDYDFDDLEKRLLSN